MIKTTPTLTSTQFGVLTRHMGFIKPENLEPQARHRLSIYVHYPTAGLSWGKSRAKLTASVVGNVRVVDRVETAWPWGSFHLTFVGVLRGAVGVGVGDGVRGPATMTPPQPRFCLVAAVRERGMTLVRRKKVWDGTARPCRQSVSRRSVPMEIWRSILFHFQSGHGFNHSRLHGLAECADG